MSEPDQQDRPTGAFPVSDLTRRLLRRGSEPIGVIDTRHTVELHGRASLLGRRTELLDGLKTRYGLAQNAGDLTAAPAAAMPFIAPFQRMAASLDLPPMSPSSARALAASATDAPAPALPESSAPHYRVKRPDRHAEPNQSRSPASAKVTAATPATGGARAGRTADAAMPVQRKVDMPSSPGGTQDSPAPPPSAAAADPAGPVNDHLVAQSGAVAAPLRQAREQQPRTAGAAPMQLQRRPDRTTAQSDGNAEPARPPASNIAQPVAATTAALGGQRTSETSLPGVSALPVVRAIAVGHPDADDKVGGGSLIARSLPPVGEVVHTAGAAQMPLQRKRDDAEEAGQSLPSDAVAPASRQHALPVDDAPVTGSLSTSLPLQREAVRPMTAAPDRTSTSLPLQREAERPMTAAPETVSVQPVQAAAAPSPAATPAQPRNAVAAEIPPAPLLPTGIVWRKADINDAGRESARPAPFSSAGAGYANGAVVMREAAAGEPGPSGDAAPVAAPAAGGEGVDVVRIAEEVSRILARQLRVERERRGRTR